MRKLVAGVVLMFIGAVASGGSLTPPSCNSKTQNCWIDALIAQYPADTSSPQAIHLYVAKINALAPALQQLHLRIMGPLSNTYSVNDEFKPPVCPTSLSGDPGAWCESVAQTAQLIDAVRETYSSPDFIVGFHPDNSSSSYSSWGCAAGDAVCVFSNSIGYMNAVNAALAAQTPAVNGFGEFSIEQSYVENVSGSTYISPEKSCLSSQGGAGTLVPGVCTIAANPGVRYANTPNGCYPAAYMGSQGFDDNFPQMYNLEHDMTVTTGVPFDESLFNKNLVQAGQTYAVMDANLYCAKDSFDNHTILPGSLCTSNPVGQTHPQTIYQARLDAQGNPLPINPQAVANYYGWLLANRFGSTTVPFPCGQTPGTQYITLSGEPEFLGAPGWTLAALNAFHTQLVQALASEGVNTSNLEFAIWNFSSILQNIPSTSIQLSQSKRVSVNKTQ